MPDAAKLEAAWRESQVFRFNGLEVVTDDTMTVKRWVFPERRFVEYGPEDEGWARRLGFGHEVTEPSKTVYRVYNRLYMHPTTLEALKQHLDRERQITEALFHWPINGGFCQSYV